MVKILKYSSTILLVLIGYVVYIALTTKRHSPQELARFKQHEVNIEIVYCKPYAKGRVIFGYPESGALIKYGEYWRLGANEATTVSFSKDVEINEKQIPAGTYSIYAYPNYDYFEIILNKEYDRWGYFAPDKSNDIIAVKVPHKYLEEYKEQLTIDFTRFVGGVMIDFMWANTEFHLPVTFIL